jgi:hypothetical protein
MRDWCFVIDATSPRAAKEIGGALGARGFDTDIEKADARVWCFANSGASARLAATSAQAYLEAESLWESAVQRPPSVRVWNDARHTYVEPEHPEEDPDSGEVWIDSELEPGDVRCRVRLELESVFEFRRVRRQLPELRRPVIGTGNRTIDLGARDEADATEVAIAARRLAGVATVSVHTVGGRLRRWWLRQELAGNYLATDDGSGPREYHFNFGGAGGHGGGGDSGGGHGGGGGGHGH